MKAIRTLDTSWVQTLPVIALTARSDMDENYLPVHMGSFAGCLHKPFTINELFTAIFQATGKDVPAAGNPAPHTAPAKENHPQQETLDFSALTAFSEDDPETLEPVEYYCKLPADCSEREVFVVDPMLATGGSSAAAIQMLKDKGVKHIRFMCILAAPEGVKKMQEAHPDVDMYIGALDDHLNDHGYIVPGLGDAGDRIFGTK